MSWRRLVNRVNFDLLLLAPRVAEDSTDPQSRGLPSPRLSSKIGPRQRIPRAPPRPPPYLTPPQTPHRTHCRKKVAILRKQILLQVHCPKAPSSQLQFDSSRPPQSFGRWRPRRGCRVAVCFVTLLPRAHLRRHGPAWPRYRAAGQGRAGRPARYVLQYVQPSAAGLFIILFVPLRASALTHNRALCYS